jgi:8-oxo-dGTP pyrophosphatase MutT (NUDIX family)
VTAEHSAGAIIFRQDRGTIRYLLLHYEEGHWGSSKGHTENGETDAETARREIHEETGLTDILFIEGFTEHNRYFYMSKGQRIFKTVTFLLAQTHTDAVQISFEHIGYEWLDYNSALEKITFADEKKVLQKADLFITGHPSILKDPE